MSPISNDLFDLVKSLNRREKGYVSKHLAKQKMNSGSNNLLLFKAIDQMKEYSDAELTRLLQGNAVLGYLPRAKTYLHQSILKILRDYFPSQNTELGKLQNLENVVVLYHLGLVEQAKKQLTRLRKNEKELPAYLQIGALYQELLILLFTNVLEEGKDIGLRLNKLQERVRQEGHSIESLSKLQGMIFDRKKASQTKDFAKKLASIQIPSGDLSDLALDIGLRGQTLKAYFQGNEKTFGAFSRERIETLQHSKIYEMYPILKLNAINNRLSYIFLHGGDMEEAEMLLGQLAAVHSSRFVETRFAFRRLLFSCKLMLTRLDFAALKSLDREFQMLVGQMPGLSFSGEKATINTLLGICHALVFDYASSKARLQLAYQAPDIGSALHAICLWHMYFNAMETEQPDQAELYLSQLESRALQQKIPVLGELLRHILQPHIQNQSRPDDRRKSFQRLVEETNDYVSMAFFQEGFLGLRLPL